MITLVSSLCRNRVLVLNKALNVHKPLIKFSISNRSIGTLPKPTKSLFLRLQQWKTCITRNITKTENKILPTQKVINNVVLYKHERETYYRMFAIFAAVQFVCLYTAASNIFTVYYNDLFKKYENWKMKFAQLAVPWGCFSVLVLCGPLIFSISWFIISRTVKYVFLLRGGRELQFVTYHPVKGESTMTVPLQNVNCISSRFDIASYVKIKVNNKYYIIDREGQFLNPDLFDRTVGVHRKE